MQLSSVCSQKTHRHHQSCHHQSISVPRSCQTEHAQRPHCHHNQPCQRRRHYVPSLTLVLSVLAALLFLDQCAPSTSLIVPNELPSILSLVYSNIPPIKKGTDSRVGFGFRLGEHADFQVMVELGPQKETRPIGDQDSGSSFNKRQVNKSQQRAVQREVAKTERPKPNTWLETWASQVNNDATPVAKKKIPPKAKSTKKQIAPKQVPVQVMPPMPQNVPPQAIQQLQMLYKLATTSTTEEILPQVHESTTTTSSPVSEPASSYLQDRLKGYKAPANMEELQALMQKSQEQTKAEITKELMDVNLDE